MDILTDYPNPVEAAYPTGDINESIPLYSGALQLAYGQALLDGTGVIKWTWLPYPNAIYEFSSAPQSVSAWDPGQPSELRIPEGIIEESEGEDLDQQIDTPTLQVLERLVDFTRGSGKGMRRVTFHVANMPYVRGSDLSTGRTWWKGRISLEAGGWRITFDARPDHKTIESQLRRIGGYAVTHTGQLERIDGGGFSPEEASDAFELIRACLSFAFGRSISPSLATGFDGSGRVVWQDWRAFVIAPWRTSHAIIDKVVGAPDLEELFLRIGNIWGDSFVRELVTRAIQYYLASNDPNPINVAVSNGQAGLELLAYEKLVEDLKRLTDREYRSPRNPAHKNINRLLSEFRVRGKLPKTLTALHAAAKSQKCSSGPEILTKMRNGVTHPSRSKPKYNTEAWIEAWELMCRYLILCILARIDFQGSFSDPIEPNKMVGTVARVPWA